MKFIRSILSVAGILGCFFVEGKDIPRKGELRINEILYEAIPSDAEYLELYNCTSRRFDLREIRIAKRSEAGELTSVKQITDREIFLEPDGLVWICSNKEAILAVYSYNDPDNCLVISTKLGYADGGGRVVLLNSRNETIDELAYGKYLHNSWIKNTRGVALERLQEEGGDPGRKIWTSAAGSEETGYGSPGMPNRAGLKDAGPEGRVELNRVPEVFTPDGDGLEDVVKISVRDLGKEFMLQVSIYNSRGNLVREITDGTPAYSGIELEWDGTNGRGQLMPAGIYVIYARYTRSDGYTRTFREVCVLSR